MSSKVLHFGVNWRYSNAEGRRIVANSRLIKIVRANDDILAGFKWLATLDSHTCARCAARDGLPYTLDLQPIGHSLVWGRGPGKIHRHCRCTYTFVLKSADELKLRGLKPATRASMNGQVPGDTTYAEWLKGQHASIIDDMLGPTRGKMYREGRLTLSQFLSDDGLLVYRLKELIERHTEALRGFKL